ncbi:MAG: hypothetical protein GF333_01215 [Candidatus Omnitrophica bacterium]|nr:hypothetical protein [Candidatus Omnitrophota bacterium]
MKKLIICVIALAVIPCSAHANYIFQDIYGALRNGVSGTELRELEAHYAHKFINGKGYVTRIEKNRFEDVRVTLSTEASPYSPFAVKVTLMLKDSFALPVHVNKGDYVVFSGTFTGLSGVLDEVMVSNAVVSPYGRTVDHDSVTGTHSYGIVKEDSVINDHYYDLLNRDDYLGTE